MARKIEVEIVGDSSSYQRALAKAQGRSQGFGRVAKAAGLAAVGLGVAMAVGAKKSIDAASNLAESVNAVNVVFGKGADKIHAFGETAATTAGLSARAFNEAVTPIGASLRNVGLGADEAAEASIELTKRAADLASVFNTDVGTALQAIQAALRGETDPIEKFGASLNEASIEAYAVKEGIAEAGEELTNSQKVVARYGLLMDQTNRVSGDFVNTSDGLANMQRILRSRLENVAATIGRILMPAVLAVVGFISDTALPVLEDFVGFLKRVADASTIKAKLNIVWTGVKGTVSDLLDKMEEVLLGGAPTPLKLPSGKIMEWDRSSTQGLLDKFAPVLASGDWAAIGQAVGEGIGRAIKFSAGTLSNLLNQLTSWVDANSAKIGAVGLKIVLEMVNAMGDPAFWKKNWALIASVILTAVPIGRIFKIGSLVATAFGKAFGQTAARLFADFIRVVDGQLKRIPGFLRAAFKISLIFTFITSVQRGIQRLIDWMRDQWNRLPGIIRAAVSGVGGILLNAFIGPLSTIIDKVQDLIGWIKSAVGSAGSLGSSVGAVAGGVAQRAAGGPVSARNPYIVGERGPELFVPGSSGRIVPNGALAGGGGGTVQVVVVGGDQSAINWLRRLDSRYERNNGRSMR